MTRYMSRADLFLAGFGLGYALGLVFGWLA
jgi:hypothetical protein